MQFIHCVILLSSIVITAKADTPAAAANQNAIKDIPITDALENEFDLPVDRAKDMISATVLNYWVNVYAIKHAPGGTDDSKAKQIGVLRDGVIKHVKTFVKKLRTTIKTMIEGGEKKLTKLTGSLDDKVVKDMMTQMNQNLDQILPGIQGDILGDAEDSAGWTADKDFQAPLDNVDGAIADLMDIVHDSAIKIINQYFDQITNGKSA